MPPAKLPSLPGCRQLRRATLAVALALPAAAALAAAFVLYYATPSFTAPVSAVMYSAEGRLLGASVAADEQWRFPAVTAVPENVAKAIILFEDRRFYAHCGIDPFAVVRAAARNVSGGRIVSGASTITMQTVRLALGNRRRTWPQKIRESLLALLLELRYTKKQILALYASYAPFGGNVVGLEAASWRYFGRSSDHLTWAEAATLAVLPNQPALVHPAGDRDRLFQKRNRLLKALHEKGLVDSRELELAVSEPLPGAVLPLPRLAPQYFERLKRSRVSLPASKKSDAIRTTIVYDTQRLVAQKLENWSTIFASWGIYNGAILVLDTKTGDVIAYQANTGKEEMAHAVDLVTAQRSSGSLLKPFLYAAMLDAGLLMPKQLMIDIPTRMGSYRPENNIADYLGALPAEQALSRSLNVPFVRGLRAYGVEPFLRLLKKCGFTTFWRTAETYGLPLILGGGEITLEEATAAYAALMRAASGQEENFPLSPGACWLTLEALLNGIRPEEESSWQYYASAKRIAWKTGTSFGSRDCWAVGVTPTYTVGIWIGNAEGSGRPELKSITTSAPLLFDVFSLLETSAWVAPPPDISEEVTCALSGYLAGRFCDTTNLSLRPAAAVSPEVCPYCRAVSLTSDGKYRATVSDLPGSPYEGTFPVSQNRFVLPPEVEYYYKSYNLRYRGLPPLLPGKTAGTETDLAVLFPENGSQIYIPVEADGAAGKVVAQVFHRRPSTKIYWDLDGDYIGATSYIHQLEIRPPAGIHRLTVTDDKGGFYTVRFEILSR